MNDPASAPGLKDRLRADLTAAMKARESVTVGTLRMALSAITNAEVAGDEARTLTDEEVVGVLTKEVKKRHESAEVYAGAGRNELADKENAEAEILRQYLPEPLTDAELRALVDERIAGMTQSSGQAPGRQQMGQLIKSVKAAAGARVDGGRVADAVKAALSH